MLQKKNCYTFLITWVMCCQHLSAQQIIPEKLIDSALINKVMVGKILLTGNKKTKESIILREIPFRSGEAYTMEELVKKFEMARRQLMNTALFNNVIVASTNTGENRNSPQTGMMDISIEVKERWYLYPLPVFKPVDRNLNQWLVEQKGSLKRINYGARLYYYNATGRNDKLRVGFLGGYTNQVSFNYDRLYIDKKLKWGIKVAFATGKNREVNYNTINDKQAFIKDENNYIRSFTNVHAELTYRRAIKTRHSIGFGYTTEQLSDTILKLNPSYFKSGRNRINFPGIYYNLTYFDLDFIPYPTKGYAAELSIGKSGFNSTINVWQVHAKGLANWPITSKFFISLNVYGGIKLPFKQPYYNLRFLGYGDAFMPGFEYFVVDGVAGGYGKTTFTRELFNFNINTPSIKKGKESSGIPIRIFAKTFGNAGYVYNPQSGENTLSNKMLYSGGMGIDILAFYNITFKLEWTFNSLGQNGLFLHRKTTF
jgi:outer membrane protein assembly factor BamA